MLSACFAGIEACFAGKEALFPDCRHAEASQGHARGTEGRFKAALWHAVALKMYPFHLPSTARFIYHHAASSDAAPHCLPL